MADLTIVTTCKGRLQHLQQTLPLMVAQPGTKTIVVDYGCPDRSGDWVRTHYPDVLVVEVMDDPGFCPARARNAGAAHAETRWIAFIDADIRLAATFAPSICTNLVAGRFYLANPGRIDTYGSCVCETGRFRQIGGYDETFVSWGGEDEDLYLRLRRSGAVRASFPAELISPIAHDDPLRTRFFKETDKTRSHRANVLYITAKLELEALSGIPMDLAARKALRQTSVAAVTDAVGENAGSLTVQAELNFPNLAEFGLKLERTIQYRLVTNGRSVPA